MNNFFIENDKLIKEKLIIENENKEFSCSLSQTNIMNILNSLNIKEFNFTKNFISFDDKLFNFKDDIYIQEVFFKFFFCDYYLPQRNCIS